MRAELSCGACGAPLHEMKHMPLARKTVKSEPQERVVTHVKEVVRYVNRPAKSKRPKKDTRRKKHHRKGWFARMVEEVVDEIEDIFD